MAGMTWFRRRKQKATDKSAGTPAGQGPAPRTDPAEAALRFWARWDELLPTISAALGERELSKVEHELYEAVAAVHPDLHFSLDRGQQAVYALVVSGQEDPELRPYTDAWMAAAPANDVLWEYHDSVPAVPDPNGVTVTLSGYRISLADFLVSVQVDEKAGVVDVAVYHPTLSELDEPGRSAMTFLPLDATLGERLAGERLRRVETALHRPDNAITLRELRDLVRRLAGLPAIPVEDQDLGPDLGGS
ncbi:MAG TPA: hypothetical protein VHF06_37425 [Pseudonocardiaceae bacterium]|jgi:hypothetical protein|nr:hypothetical protein [Pseudonocardiaceae bacterium]